MTTLANRVRLLSEIKEASMPIGALYLSEKMNIPPATVGRLLTALEKDGFLEKSSNKGRVLTSRGLDYLEEQNNRAGKQKTADTLIDMVEDISPKRLLEILEVRCLLEGRAIELTCQNASEEDIRHLDNILVEHAYDFTHGGLGSEQDLKLHMAIAKLSGQSTITKILKLILTKDNAYTKFSAVADHVKSLQLKQHRAIVDAIRAHDPVAGHQAMKCHLKQVAMDVETYLSGEVAK